MSSPIYRSFFASDFQEIENILNAYQRCIKDDEREEIIGHLSGKLVGLKGKVMEAERAGRGFLHELRDMVNAPQSQVISLQAMEQILNDVSQKLAGRLYGERRPAA